MRMFGLILLFVCFPISGIAQQSYFTTENKKLGLKYFKDKIYGGCLQVKKKQEPVLPKEIEELGNEGRRIVLENFSKAFEENPKIRAAFENEFNDLLRDPNCQKEGNDCRVKILSFLIYYYQTFRADVPGCKGYTSAPEGTGQFIMNCENELKYRKRSLEGVQGSQYGTSGPGIYKSQILQVKNKTTEALFNLLISKDATVPSICEAPLKGKAYYYALELSDPGEFQENEEFNADNRKKLPRECHEKKVSLLNEFIPIDFDEGRTSVGQDQVEPVKAKIVSFLKSNPEVKVIDVVVISSSPKTPYYKTVAGKKVIDPESNDRNLSLARERAKFVEKALGEIKSSSEKYQWVNFEAKAELAGPDFRPVDLNDRFVTKMTPGYSERVEAVFKEHQKRFRDEALKSSYDELLDEKQFVNLYQVKFKPFHGFLIKITGLGKEELKCLGLPKVEEKQTPGTSKQ